MKKAPRQRHWPATLAALDDALRLVDAKGIVLFELTEVNIWSRIARPPVLMVRP